MVTRLLCFAPAIAGLMVLTHGRTTDPALWTLAPAGADALLRRHVLSERGERVSSSSHRIAGLRFGSEFPSEMRDSWALWSRPVVSAAVSGDGRSLACLMDGSPDRIVVHAIATGAVKRTWTVPGRGRAMKLDWSGTEVRLIRSVAIGGRSLREVVVFSPKAASGRAVVRTSRLKDAYQDGARYAKAADRAILHLQGLPLRLPPTPCWGGSIGTFLGFASGTPSGCVALDSPHSALRERVDDVSDVQCIVVRRVRATVGRIPLNRGERVTALRFRGRFLLVSYLLGNDGLTDVWSLAPLRKASELPGALVADGLEDG
ncbi:MAG: hypothetical protein FJX72_19220 [Armatimonadetes bacterium]|nr:hypothetical protein [Armatimonadota bacterium]